MILLKNMNQINNVDIFDLQFLEVWPTLTYFVTSSVLKFVQRWWNIVFFLNITENVSHNMLMMMMMMINDDDDNNNNNNNIYNDTNNNNVGNSNNDNDNNNNDNDNDDDTTTTGCLKKQLTHSNSCISWTNQHTY